MKTRTRAAPASPWLTVERGSFADLAQRVPELGLLIHESRSCHPRPAQYCQAAQAGAFRARLRQLPLSRAELAEVLFVLVDGLPPCRVDCACRRATEDVPRYGRFTR